MRGRYRDTLTEDGRSTTTGWRKNLVVDRCYALLAGLAKNEPDLSGVLFMALGGPPSGSSELPQPSDLRLQNEIHRQAISPAGIGFLDGADAPTRVPTSRLSMRIVLRGEDLGATPGIPARLHEFGLFGGDASANAGSGFLINRVVHDPIEIAADAVLERRVELDFGAPATRGGPIEVAAAPCDGSPGPFGDLLPIRAIDGVGSRNRDALLRAGLATVDTLAARDPEAVVVGMDRGEHSEIVSKARLIRNSRLPRTALALGDVLAVDVVQTDPVELAARIRGTLRVDEVRAVQHTLSVLEMALDGGAFAAIRIRDLVATPTMWAAHGTFGPYGADLSTDAIQGVGEKLQAVLREGGIQTVGDLVDRAPSQIGPVGPSGTRKVVTKAWIIRRIAVPPLFAALGDRTLHELVRSPAQTIASATGGAARRADVERLQDALRVLEMSMSQRYFDVTRLHSLLGSTG
jgi:hypothetical protein